MKSTFEFSQLVDVENALLEYRFGDSIAKSIENKIQFEIEESHFAPEPSVASRVRAENDYEFILIYLKVTKRLLVFGELNANRADASSIFEKELPEMAEYLIKRYD